MNRLRRLLELLKEAYYFYSALFIQKDKNIWVFGALRGQKYLDNSRYLFEYVHKFTKIQAVWISRDKKLVEKLRELGYKAFSDTSKEGIAYLQKAKVAVITHRGTKENGDLPFCHINSKTKIIQLWHGIPLKKVAFDDTIFSYKVDETKFSWKLKSFIKKTFLPFLDYVHKPSMIIALSKDTKDIFSQAFRIPNEQVVITGYPRNDMLLESKVKLDGIKKIIYMPTFRGNYNTDFYLFLQYGFDIQKLDNYLSQHNMQLDIKLHPFNKPSQNLLKQLESSKSISFIDTDSIYEILDQYSLLLTDYSSIYFDYLLLDRPIIFTPFDKENYLQQDRDFYFDYEEVTPGPKANNWDEVLEYIRAFEKDKTLYEKERQQLKDRFHVYQDANSTKRVYEAIIDLLK